MTTMQTTPSPSKPQRAASLDWPQGALPANWIDALLTKFEVYYGDKFHRQWANVPRDAMRKQWAIDLGQLSRDELSAGVEALKYAEWPPTLPEFIALCKPPFDYAAALYEAIEQIQRRDSGQDKWSRPEIYWAAIQIGRFDLLNVPQELMLKRFTAALKQAIAEGRSDPVPPRAPALPAPGKAVADKGRVEAELAKIKALQNRGPTNLDWAHRIIARKDAGEKLAYMTVKMAESALAQYKGEGK